MVDSDQQRKLIFILGSERSGSTWLANIFDAHPRVSFFMEPFRYDLKLFPELADRNLYLSNGNDALVKSLANRLSTLNKAKHCLFYSPGKASFLQTVDYWLSQRYSKLKAFLPTSIERRLFVYRNLNLNALGRSPEYKFVEDQPSEANVIKELRVNFKTGLLAQSFPNARYVVICRNPATQIKSIKRLFNQKSLQELGLSLQTFGEAALGQTRFQIYRPIFEKLDWKTDVDTRLIIWWLINYQVLCADLRSRHLSHEIVYHEKLSNEPQTVVSQLLDFCHLSNHPKVQSYISSSSTTQSETSQSNPMDTNRISSQYEKDSLASVPVTLKNSIISALHLLDEQEPLEAALKHYLFALEADTQS